MERIELSFPEWGGDSYRVVASTVVRDRRIESEGSSVEDAVRELHNVFVSEKQAWR